MDDEVPIEWLAAFLGTVFTTQNLNWLLLTKRPENWKTRLSDVLDKIGSFSEDGNKVLHWLYGNPPQNVWLGVSVEDQKRADERIPLLLNIPAKVRFLSVEPLLGPVDLGEWIDIDHQVHPDGSETPLRRSFDWVIIGGESGTKARNCDVRWIRSILDQCRESGVPAFMKQLGSRPYKSWDKPAGNTIPEIASTIGEAWTLKHAKGGDPDEWPDDLCVRQFPKP